MWSFSRILKLLAILVAVLLVLLLVWRVFFEVAAWQAYSHYFHIITSQGGVNAWLARAVSVLFAGAFWFGLRMYLSLRSEQRCNRGMALLVGTFVAFNLFMYACTRSVTAVEDGQHFVGATGDAKAWYYVTDAGDWELFPAPGYHPTVGVKLEPMTPAAAQRYEAWKRKKAQESQEHAKAEEKQKKLDAERRFRETYVDEKPLSAPGTAIVLAIKLSAADLQTEALTGRIADLLVAKGKKPASGAFKPAFYDALFDGVWKGDGAVLERLRVFDGANRPVLLGRADFAAPGKTDFEGVVSVRGTLSLVLVEKQGRRGPWTFNASGAGGDSAVATAACVKRLAEAIEVDAIFEK